MKISDWLDRKELETADFSAIDLPEDMLHKEDPDETIFYKEIRPCGLFCTKKHPFSTVERYGHWYLCRGREKQAGSIHSSPEMEWSMLTKDKDLALKRAREHIE